MHVRSCCFARIKHIVFFYVLVAVRVVPYVIVRRPIAKIPQLWGRGGMVVGLDIAPKDPA